MKPTFKAYVAGFLDADGCIAITKDKQRGFYKLSVQITQKFYLELFDGLINHFGGSVYDDKKYGKYRYHIVSNQALKLLLKITPYLLNKWDQAALSIIYQGIMKEADRLRPRTKSGSSVYPIDIYQFQEGCYKTLQDWKRTPPSETEREGRRNLIEGCRIYGNQILEKMRKRQSIPADDKCPELRHHYVGAP